MMIERGATWSGAFGRRAPNGRTPQSRSATTTPNTTPITDATTPMMSASSTHRAHDAGRREAPTARSKPTWRVRWATVI